MFSRRTARTMVAAGGALALMASGSAVAGAVTVPPSDRVFIREMPWDCGDLGTFSASYNVMGQDPALMWLSRDGSREDAVMITLIDGQVTVTTSEGSMTSDPGARHPQRAGMDQYRCELSYQNPDFSIEGWALVGVVRDTSPQA